MKRAEIVLMGMSLFFGAAIFLVCFSIAKESRIQVNQIEKEVSRAQ